MPRCIARRAVATLCAAAGALSLAAVPAGAATAPPGFVPFAPDSVWNLPLRADAPLDPQGQASVDWLNAQIATSGTWINTTSCGMPEYWADAGTPTVKVTLDPTAYQDKTLLRAWSAVPIPADARPSNCSDKNFAVLQPQPDGTVREWEFWRAVKNADGTWTAKWGGATQDVMADRGVASAFTWRDPLGVSNSNWNVTASSMSMTAGVVTFDDLSRGHIDHAVALALNDTAKGRFSWPAQRSDGASLATAALAEGAHLRLDPTLDLSTLSMAPFVRMVAEAAQKYGLVVRDKTYGVDVFYTEEPHPGQANPVPSLLGGKSPSDALKAFPWNRLQLLAATSCTGTKGCENVQRAVIDVDVSTPVTGSPVVLDTTNAVLNQPRAAVAWDLDGDGAYETPGGRAVRATWVPTSAGSVTARVRITTRSGDVVYGERQLAVTDPAAPLPTPTPVPSPAA